MPSIEVYTTPYCPYCSAAKELLHRKGAEFVEINVAGNRDLRARMVERAGGRMTVPQIFIGETHVGGCDDLYALDEAGGLDPLLARNGAAQPNEQPGNPPRKQS
jgi:glutaredoxin 3